MKSVWRSAREELENAARIIFIGYSLPQTDNFVKYLLALGLTKNESLQEIIVIDPAASSTTDGEESSLRKRYRDFIATFFDTRNLTFWDVDFQTAMDRLQNQPSPTTQDRMLREIIYSYGRQ